MQKTLVRFVSIGFVATAMIFTACKKESGKSNEEKIVGKWTQDAAYYDYNIGGISQKDTVVASEGDYIQFNSDKTVVAISEGEQSSGTWNILDNKLTITDPDVPFAPAYDIQKLTDNEMSLHLKQQDDDGYVEMTVHLTK
jgi:hypothetical protein